LDAVRRARAFRRSHRDDAPHDLAQDPEHGSWSAQARCAAGTAGWRDAGMTATSPLLHPAYLHAPAATTVVRTRAAVNWFVRLSFYLFVLSIPFEMPNRPIPIEIPTLTACIFLLATLTQPSVYRRLPGAFIWFTAYLWVFGLSTMVNRSEHTALIAIQFLSHLQLLLVLWVAVNILRERRTLRGTLLAFALAVAMRADMQVLHTATTATPLRPVDEPPTLIA